MVLRAGPGRLGLVRSAVTVTGLLALPVSMGVAIFKYRLFDIDRIVSRTLGYAIVTGLLVGVYAGLVLLATRVLAVHTPGRRGRRHAGRRRPVHPGPPPGPARSWTAGSTGPVTTPTAPSPPSPRGCRTPSTSTRSATDLLAAVDQALEPAHASVWLAGGSP